MYAWKRVGKHATSFGSKLTLGVHGSEDTLKRWMDNKIPCLPYHRLNLFVPLCLILMCYYSFGQCETAIHLLSGK